MKRKLALAWQLYRRFGFSAVARSVIDRLGSSISGRQVIELVWLESSGLKLKLDVDPKFEFRFLNAREVSEFAKDPANDLDAEMIQRAEGGRDLCFAAISGGRLAAYGWYAVEGIESEHNFGVAMSYPSTVAYMYKGFTHPDFRGARLHGLGMGLALQNLADFGVSALVSTVGWTNEASMKSCDRLGYERLGRIVTTGGENFRVTRTPQSASDRGIRLGKNAVQRTIIAQQPTPAPVQIAVGV
jgi:hypothetical protein